MPDTELRLAAWRDGSTQAERLASALLRLSGYEGIDPQAPIGGPDGGSDILCTKGGLRWTGAVYFPPTPVGFNSIKKKFSSDLSKVPGENLGFVFVTNRSLSPTQRKTLEALGTAADKQVDIFHLERIRALLDAPRGYGLRLQFLNLPMTTEDQLAWFSESDDRVIDAINLTTRELLSIKDLLRRMTHATTEMARTMVKLGATMPPTPDLISTTNFVAEISTPAVSASIDVPTILLVHRLVCFDMPTRSVGVIRNSEVVIGNGRDSRSIVSPPRADKVKGLLEMLCDRWRNDYAKITSGRSSKKVEEIARFHGDLLRIHPFTDGNGRAARAVMMQQCLDLFGKANMSLLDQGSNYYHALHAADSGDMAPLAGLIRPVVDF